VETNHQEKSLI